LVQAGATGICASTRDRRHVRTAGAVIEREIEERYDEVGPAAQ
jgi:hypothetical protein